MATRKLLLKDLPTGMCQLLLLFWQTEEATGQERHLPEPELVEAFLQWFLKEYSPEEMLEGDKKFLEENGYPLIPSGS